jgi:ATP-dependent protease ClpP protease subunit
MGRQRRIKQRRAVGAAVTRTGIGSVDVLDREQDRADRTQAARERSAGHEPSCTCNATPRADSWFKVRNYVDQPNRAAVYIYEEIGYWGCTAMEFVQILNQLNVDFLDVHINSPGGEVDDGVAIFNAIRQHKAHVTTYIDGLAASAASFIAMAGDVVRISQFGQVMIHDAMGIEFGNAAEMRSYADLLDRYSDNIAGIYAQQSGGTTEQWRELMRAETWFTGPEAVEAGLCDEVYGLVTPDEDDDDGAEGMTARMTARRWDLSLYNFRFKGRDEAPTPALLNQDGGDTPPVPEPSAVEPASDADLVAAETPAAPAEDTTPDAGAVATPTEFGSAGLGTEPADTTPPAAEPDPVPAAPDVDQAPEPVEHDGFAVAASALLSAIPAPPNPDDAFDALKGALLS